LFIQLPEFSNGFRYSAGQYVISPRSFPVDDENMSQGRCFCGIILETQ